MQSDSCTTSMITSFSVSSLFKRDEFYLLSLSLFPSFLSRPESYFFYLAVSYLRFLFYSYFLFFCFVLFCFVSFFPFSFFRYRYVRRIITQQPVIERVNTMCIINTVNVNSDHRNRAVPIVKCHDVSPYTCLP